jgi:hypothetical protein
MRSAGSFSRARPTAAAKAGGVDGRMREIGGGGVVRCCRTTLAMVGPVNGGSPASIS